MKKTQFIELLHTIGKTWVSFFSIVMFVALGVGIFLGLTWAGQAAEEGAKADFDLFEFHNFEISYPYGITQENIDAIAGVDGVEKVEGAYSASGTFTYNKVGHVAKILSLTESLDKLRVIEGHVPEAADEAAIDSTFAKNNHIKLGDSISFKTVSKNPLTGKPLLKERTFKIAAIAAHPAFVLSQSSTRGMADVGGGVADSFFVLLVSAFDLEAYGNCYSNAYVLVNTGAAANASANTEAAQRIFAALCALGTEEGDARYQELHDEAQAKIDYGEEQIKEGQAKIKAGQRQVDEGRVKIADGEKQAAEGRAKLDSAKQQLDQYQAMANEAEKQVDEKLGELAGAIKKQGGEQAEKHGMTGSKKDIKKKLRGKLDTAVAKNQKAADLAKELGFTDKLPEKLENQINDALTKYKLLKEKEAQLAQGWQQYRAGEETYKEKLKQLEDAKVKLAEGEKQLEDAKTKLEDAEKQLADGKEKLAKMVPYDWSIAGRDSNLGLVGLKSYHDSTDRLRWSMALVFVIVGLLVCYTAVSRIVREEVVSIGTKKALGLRSHEITLAYLLYSIMAVIIGVILAVITAVIIQIIIASKVSGQFTFTKLPIYISLLDIAVMGGIELVCITFATWLACRRMLTKRAIELLRGSEPPKDKTRFYEKFGFWNKMPLYSQSVVNNLFNDKTRVAGTIIGVAGSTALVVIALMLYLNINDSFAKHFEEVYLYDARIAYEPSVENVESEIAEVLEANGIASTNVERQTLGLVNAEGSMEAVTLIVPEESEAFGGFYGVNAVSAAGDVNAADAGFADSRDAGNATDADGIWVTQAYAEHQGARVGDLVKLMDTSGKTYEVPIAGVFEYWLNNQEMIMSKGLYQAIFEKEPLGNTLLANFNGANKKEIQAQLEKVQGFTSLTDEYERNRSAFNTFQSLTKTVVYVYLVLSVLMSLVVLMNLVMMFIDEKKREIIVLRINGFSVHAAKAYIYRDNIVLTLIGIVLGIGLGILGGYFSLLSVEMGASRYIHTPNLIACLAGVAVSAVLAVIINAIALRRIPRFVLTDINKM